MPQPPSAPSEGGPGATAAPLVEVGGLSKSYRQGRSETQVLEEAELELGRGETASLMGASGSGKSTLVSLLSGLLLPESGRIVFDGADITALDDGGRARIRARRIGVVLQSGNLIPFLTAAENVELAIELAGGKHPGRRARELLSELGLGRRLEHKPQQLSGGEAQRVAVATALANRPDLLLADEVTGELDSSNADQVMELIFDAWREHGLTVLFVTHSDELASRAQRRLRLADGRIRNL